MARSRRHLITSDIGHLLGTFTQPGLSMGGATSAERLETLVPEAAKRIHQSGRQADD